MNLHSKKSRCGIVVHRDFFKLQLWNFRLYLSRVPMKPNLYAGTWKSFRKRMLKTSDKCAICGTQLNIATLSVHHIKPRSEYPDLAYDPDNCQCLCANCHRYLHYHEDHIKAGKPVAV